MDNSKEKLCKVPQELLFGVAHGVEFVMDL
jgi:hypothetical protein